MGGGGGGRGVVSLRLCTAAIAVAPRSKTPLPNVLAIVDKMLGSKPGSQLVLLSGSLEQDIVNSFPPPYNFGRGNYLRHILSTCISQSA